MKKYGFILATLVIIFSFGCSPTIIHKHYHYYPADIGECDNQPACSKKMPGGKMPCGHLRGEMEHAGMQHGMHHAGLECAKQHGVMKHGGMKQMSHRHGMQNMQMCRPDCPCGCQKGQSCNCPNRTDESAESLFSE